MHRKGSGSSDGTTPSVDSHGEDTMPERKGRDEEFEQLLEKYNVDEIEAKPKNFYSHVCNRWVSLSGVSTIVNLFALAYTQKLSAIVLKLIFIFQF